MRLIRTELANRLLAPDTRKGEIDRARRALSNSRNLDNRQQAEKWAILGEGYKWEKQPSLAEEAYLQAIELIQALKDETLLAEAYQALGDAWYFCAGYERCILYYEQAAKIFERQDVSNWVGVLSQIAYAYARMDRREDEQRILEMVIAEPTIDQLFKALFLERKAMSLSVSNVKDAIVCYEEALGIFTAANFKRDWEKRLQFLAQLYETAGEEK